ncbi:hypothetical protein C2S52_001466 [Perilla frutescens var. hirtella]|nr:hypothetical protein C2S52_001466 [Perilla frutescens var. hirtella]
MISTVSSPPSGSPPISPHAPPSPSSSSQTPSSALPPSLPTLPTPPTSSTSSFTRQTYMDKRDLCEPLFSAQTPKNGNHIYFSCNGNADFARGPGSQDRLSNGELHFEVEVLVRLSRCDYVPEGLQTKNCGVSSFQLRPAAAMD